MVYFKNDFLAGLPDGEILCSASGLFPADPDCIQQADSNIRGKAFSFCGAECCFICIIC